MNVTNGAAGRAMWEVLWIKDGKVQHKDVGHDLAEGVRLFTLLKSADRKGVTLRCKNMQFAPPDKYADRETVEMLHPRTGKVVRGKRIMTPRRYETRMMHMNRRGLWWCPYCMQFRKFVKKPGFYVGDVWNENAHLACPMCGASHRIVSKFNPLAEYIAARRVTKTPAQKAATRRKRREARLAAMLVDEDAAIEDDEEDEDE